jgi:hypothetical protein
VRAIVVTGTGRYFSARTPPSRSNRLNGPSRARCAPRSSRR